MIDPVHLFLHVPKTGGTTINAHLAEHLGMDDGFVHLGPVGRRRRRDQGLAEPRDWPKEQLENVVAVGGHGVRRRHARWFAPRPARLAVVLRDPAERLASVYNFAVSRNGQPELDPEQWLLARDRNTMLRFLGDRVGADSVSGVVERLDSFWFVGVTHELNVDLPVIFEALEVPTQGWADRRVAGDENSDDLGALGVDRAVTSRQFELDERFKALVRQHDPLDVELFETAVMFRHRWRSAVDASGHQP